MTGSPILPYKTAERFYEAEVVVTAERQAELVKETRLQAQSAAWYAERRKRITASVCKSFAVCKPSSVTRLVQEKLAGGFRGNTVTRYGKDH